jgi:hypothetical protein
VSYDQQNYSHLTKKVTVTFFGRRSMLHLVPCTVSRMLVVL